MIGNALLAEAVMMQCEQLPSDARDRALLECRNKWFIKTHYIYIPLSIIDSSLKLLSCTAEPTLTDISLHIVLTSDLASSSSVEKWHSMSFHYHVIIVLYDNYCISQSFMWKSNQTSNSWHKTDFL